MAYPLAPDFTSAGPDVLNPPAWWTYTRNDGSLNVCETTGAAAVRRIRAALGLSAIPVWDADLQNALIARAQSLSSSLPSSGWAPLIADIQAGLAQQRPSTITMQFGVWIAYYQPNNLRLDAIAVDSTSRMPSFGATLPDGPQGDVLVCLDPNRDPLPGQYSQGDLANAQGQSSYGIRLHDGESLPVGTAPLPPGPSGLSTNALIAIGAVVLAGTAIVVILNSSYSAKATTSRSPRRSRRNSR